ncbi:MAG: 16S rRNA (cytidine(1402)-2'-O)-methyltransferase [Bacteroidetes bacterium]|nr:16S rRNA (cytidine(1402)-2'-O)-methyltransferase [Bacteroidota bacterium]
MENNQSAGTLYIVATPIGNLEDISFRALKVLSTVDIVACEDTRTTKILLHHYSIEKKLISYHSYNEVRRIPELLQHLQRGLSIALVSDAGTPGISDPAMLFVREALDASIPVIPIPGPSALLAALIVSGIPCKQFVFEGFLPKKKGRNRRIDMLKEERRTIVLYESPKRIVRTLQELRRKLGNRKIALTRELTKKYEEVIRGTFEDVLRIIERKPVRGECVLVIEGS